MSRLETNRLILRPFRLEDAQAVFDNYASDEKVTKYCSWYAHKEVSESEAYLKEHLNDKYRWAIVLKEDKLDRPIGCIDVININEDNEPEVGYVLSSKHWNKGYMTEALNAVITELFNCGFKAIDACHFVENISSGRVMQKCKMSYVGIGEIEAKGKKHKIDCYRIIKV